MLLYYFTIIILNDGSVMVTLLSINVNCHDSVERSNMILVGAFISCRREIVGS